MSEENLERKKALEVAMGQIEKQFGKGSLMKLGEFKARKLREKKSFRSSNGANRKTIWKRFFNEIRRI